MRGQQLSVDMLGDQPLAVAALPVEEGDIAMSFDFTNSGRVAGFVQPGSRVVVFGTAQQGAEQRTRVLLDDVKVLAVGPSTAASELEGSEPANPGEERAPTLVTLSLSPPEEKIVINANSKGSLFLGLRYDDSQISTDTEVS